VTKTGSVTGGVELAVDFGTEPCQASSVPGLEDVWEGSATGTFDLLTQSIELEFDEVTCNSEALSGSVLVGYILNTDHLELDGDWDLEWLSDGILIGTNGIGICAYDRVVGEGGYDVTSIPEFDGTVTDSGYEWLTVITDLMISLEKYFAFMPYSGIIGVDGPDIRPITIAFSENSPASGEVTITITGGRSATVNLWDLIEEIEEMPLPEESN